MTQATRWLPTGAYEETRAAPAVGWAAPGAPLAITETQTAAAVGSFIADFGRMYFAHMMVR